MVCSSPDSSENPFAFFFKKQKIATDSGNSSKNYLFKKSKTAVVINLIWSSSNSVCIGKDKTSFTN